MLNPKHCYNELCYKEVPMYFFLVSLSDGCNSHKHDPVCDTNGEEFTNFCVLLSKGRYLDFRGHCPVSYFSAFSLHTDTVSILVTFQYFLNTTVAIVL